MSELKPCPFCGGEPMAIETHPGRGELYCGTCDVVLGGNNAMTPEELTAAWNTRHVETCKRHDGFCSECGMFHVDGIDFCPYCGRKVEG